MIVVATMLAGLAIGIALGRLWGEHAHVQRALKLLRGNLPAATARGITRQAKRNRADLRRVLPAREHGVRVRLPRVLLEEPRFLPDDRQ